MFATGLPFLVPEILEFKAIREKFSSNFPGVFPELSCRTPAQTPETATAFLSFLNNFGQFSHVLFSHVLFLAQD